MSQQLFSLVYVSSAVTLFTDDDLAALLAVARERNRSHQVTGLLLHSEGNFVQALEGTQAGLDLVLAHIRLSRRHTGLMTLYHEPITQREFGDWDMAFSRVDRTAFHKLDGGAAPARRLLHAIMESMR